MQEQSWQLWAHQRALTPLLHKETLRPLWVGEGQFPLEHRVYSTPPPPQKEAGRARGLEKPQSIKAPCLLPWQRKDKLHHKPQTEKLAAAGQ